MRWGAAVWRWPGRRYGRSGGIPLGSCVYALLNFITEKGRRATVGHGRRACADCGGTEGAGHWPGDRGASQYGAGILSRSMSNGLCHELRAAGIACERQVPIPVIYKGLSIGDGFRADIVVGSAR